MTSSEDDCAAKSPLQTNEFGDEDLNIDIDILISEVQARPLLWDFGIKV